MKSDSSFEQSTEVSFFKGSRLFMGTTLYLIRQDLDRVSSSLFRASDIDMDIVFIEEATSIASSSVKGVVVAAKGRVVGWLPPTMTYDDLVGKIFSSEHVIVI